MVDPNGNFAVTAGAAIGIWEKKKYYEWDHTHNDIEVFDSKGRHIGSMDPEKGRTFEF